MPKPITQTGIVNAAASRLGSTQRLVSINDTGSDLASHAREHWDKALLAALDEHPWNFAIERAQLNSAGAPGFGYRRKFKLPADCLYPLCPRPSEDDYWEGEVEGGYIHSDAEAPLSIRYVSGELADDTTRWSGGFAEAMELELAIRLCEPMTGSVSKLDRLRDMRADAMRRAKRHNGRQDNSQQMPDRSHRSRWLQRQRVGNSPLRTYFRGS